ncbi:ATP-binding cassette domain-containing protein [bacterium]|nr:ATP-binding cassette domain-containing protein [bacterium]
MTENIIETQHLTRRFGHVVAVSELDLAVPKGCVYAFLGPNGAGKTTTIRMLLGLIRPNKGIVRLFDETLNGNKGEVLRQVGSMVEAPSLYPNLSGRENLRLLTKLLKLPEDEIDRVLDVVQMMPAADRLVKGYSTGMRQRIGLAGALLGHPSLLILDEPTSGLDPAGILEMRHLLRGLPEAFGVTVFLSTHLLNEVEQIATQIGIIKQGKLIFQGSPESLQTQLGGNAILEVDNVARARQILTGMGWQVSQNGDHSLAIVSRNKKALAKANEQLVAQGIDVYHLSQEKRSLEEIFLSLTSTEGQVAS